MFRIANNQAYRACKLKSFVNMGPHRQGSATRERETLSCVDVQPIPSMDISAGCATLVPGPRAVPGIFFAGQPAGARRAVPILVPADGDTPFAPSARLARGMKYGFKPDDDAAAAIAQVLEVMTAMPRPALWGTYWVIGAIAESGADTGEAEPATQGICGFKHAPDSSGLVEIAYYTFPALEGRGIASAMVAALLRIADGAAGGVIAHTLPERNASCAVLVRNGFTLEGEVVDPEDGPVWRWRRR